MSTRIDDAIERLERKADAMMEDASKHVGWSRDEALSELQRQIHVCSASSCDGARLAYLDAIRILKGE